VDAPVFTLVGTSGGSRRCSNDCLEDGLPEHDERELVVPMVDKAVVRADEGALDGTEL
jgi:hypothetical protein